MLKRFLPRKETGLLKKVFLWFIGISIGIAGLGIIAGAALMGVLAVGLPDVTNLENLTAAQSTQIFDRNDELLYTIHGEENRAYVPIEEISEDLVNATIALEDDAFWDHSGYDIFAIVYCYSNLIFTMVSKFG